LSDPQKIVIIIPAFNEELNIGLVLEGIQKEAPGIPVVVINDGSSDLTEQIAIEHGARVINLSYNSGYGVALQTGFIYAVQKEFSTVVHLDADGQHDPRYIRHLLEAVNQDNVDVVIGSRFLGKREYKTSFFKRLGMIVFGGIASIIVRRRVTDPTSGFQALKGKAVGFAASDFYPPDYPDADFIILLHRAGLRVREIPVTMHSNAQNKSMHRGHKTFYYAFKMVLSILVTILRKKPGIWV
tara:strand:- start:2751 stop:3473 length:723 start_codon:yes stop_codon:yes gene_type:complete